MMPSAHLPLSVPCLKGNELRYVSECIETEWVSSVGKYVSEFETRFSDYLGTPGAVAMVNGTASLHIALKLAGVGPDDEVIVPTVTFVAPVNTVRYCGAHPIFADCDAYLNIDLEKVTDFLATKCDKTPMGARNRETGRLIKACIIVHIFGMPVNIVPFLTTFKAWGISIVEDSTEALGSFYRNIDGQKKMAGTVGEYGCFSFNGNKIITTGGGGMLVAQDPQNLAFAKYLSTQAKDDELYFVHNHIGYNYRLTNVQAAIGVAQMEMLPTFVDKKRRNFRTYRRMLASVDQVSLIEEPDYAFSNCWYYALVLENGSDRAALMEALKLSGIETRPIWYLQHLQKPFQGSFLLPIETALNLYDRILNIPCSVSLSEDDIVRVCEGIATFYEKRHQ